MCLLPFGAVRVLLSLALLGGICACSNGGSAPQKSSSSVESSPLLGLEEALPVVTEPSMDIVDEIEVPLTPIDMPDPELEILDTVPDPFSFNPVVNAVPDQWYESNTVILLGIDTPLPVSVSGGMYSVDGDAFSTEVSTIVNGQTLALRLQSAEIFGASRFMTVNVGEYSSVFEVSNDVDTELPLARITFPMGKALEQDSHVTVSGVASDNEQVVSVNVNGVDAQSSDGFDTWTARVPLVGGLNTVTVSVSDYAGNLNLNVDSTVVDHQAYLYWPESIAFNDSMSKAYIGDQTFKSVVVVDVDSGVRTLLSSADRGSGPLLSSADDIVVDEVNGRLVIADAKADVVYAIDLSSGNRTILSGGGVGTGPELNAVTGIFYDTPRNRLIATDWAQSVVLEIDLNTGDRSVLSGGGIGSGASFGEPVDLDVDLEQNVAFVVDNDLFAVFKVDILSGERTLLSGMGAGEGEALTRPQSVVFDKKNQQLLVLNAQSILSGKKLYSVISVDLLSGNRLLVSGIGETSERGGGMVLGLPIQIALDTANNRILLADYGEHQLTWVALDTGDRSLLSAAYGSYSQNWKGLYSLETDHSSRRLLIGHESKMTAFNLDSGDASPLVDLSGSANGPLSRFTVTALNADSTAIYGLSNAYLRIAQFDLPSWDGALIYQESSDQLEYGSIRALEVSALEDELYLLSLSSYQFIRHNISLGDYEVMASQSIGGGSTLRYPTDFCIDRKANRLIVADTGVHSIYSIDTRTSQRSIISSYSQEIGTGPALTQPKSVVFSDVDGGVYVTSFTDDGVLMRVNVESGDRQVISSGLFDRGPSLEYSSGLAIDIQNYSAFVSDDNHDRLLQIDLITGDRIAIYR